MRFSDAILRDSVPPASARYSIQWTARELRGESYLPLGESPEPEQMIACNRFFSEQVIDLESQREVVASYTSRAAEQLRAQGDYCRML